MAGSGYNQDSNQVTPGVYRVTVTMSNATYYPTATANTSSGALWPYDWDNQVYTNGTALTAAQALVLAQGNIRWNRVLETLSYYGDCRIENVVVTASSTTDATAQPTVIAFTVIFDRDTFLLGEWNKFLASQGQSANGTFTGADSFTATAYNSLYAGSATAVNTTALALQDIITAGIISGGSSGYKRTWRVYNPSYIGDSQASVTITSPNATNSNIYGTVAVSQVSGTTLSGTPL